MVLLPTLGRPTTAICGRRDLVPPLPPPVLFVDFEGCSAADEEGEASAIGPVHRGDRVVATDNPDAARGSSRGSSNGSRLWMAIKRGRRARRLQARSPVEDLFPRGLLAHVKGVTTGRARTPFARKPTDRADRCSSLSHRLAILKRLTWSC